MFDPIRPIRLLLPALIPSWNFFDVIGPSPRVEYARLASPDSDGTWIEFRPRPDHLPVTDMIRRLAWNARWNEALFVMSCAERLLDAPTRHSEDEIYRRIAADLDGDGPPWLAFRIAVITPADDGTLARDTAYAAEPRALVGIDVR